MTLKEYYEYLLSQDKETREAGEKVQRFEKLPYNTLESEINTKINSFFETILSKIDVNKKKELAKKFIPQDQYRKVTRTLLGCYNNKIPDQHRPQTYKMLFDKVDNGQELTNKEFKKLDNAIKTTPEYEKVKDLTLLDAYVISFKKNAHELMEELDKLIPEDEKGTLIADNEKIKSPLNKKDEDRTYNPFEKEISDIKKNNNLSEEEIEALDYINDNIRYGSDEYNSAIVSQMMSKQDCVEREADMHVENYTGPKKIDISKLTEIGPDGSDRYKDPKALEEYRNLDFDLSTETKLAMLHIMNNIDSFNLVDDENILAPEEGNKEYAFRKVTRSISKISDAIKKKDIKIMPKLVEEYKANYDEMDRLFNFAQQNLNSDGKTYGCNVDVSRNAHMPMKFRNNDQSTSLISSLMIATKFCKYNGIKFEEFVNNPRKALTKGVDLMTKRGGAYGLFKGSIGSSLEKFDNPISTDMLKFAGMHGTAMRAYDAIFGMEKNPAKLDYNAYVRSTIQIEENRISSAGNQNKLIFMKNADTTFRNIFLSKPEDVDILRMCANDLIDYDYSTMKPIEKIDMKQYTLKTNYPPKEFKKNIETIIHDYCKSGVLIGKNFMDMLKGARQAVDFYIDNKFLLSEEDENALRDFKKDLGSKEKVKERINKAVDESIKDNENELYKLTGIKYSDEDFNKLFEGINQRLSNGEKECEAIKEKLFDKMYLSSLVKNGFDGSKVKYGEIQKRLDDLVRAKVFRKNNDLAVENEGAATKGVHTIKNLASNQLTTLESGYQKNLPNSIQDTVDKMLNLKADSSKDRVHGRHEYAVETMNAIWNNKEKGTKEYQTALDTSCALLSNLEKKHASRSGLWTFFHFFGQHQEEKNTIEELKNSIKQKANINDAELTAALQSKTKDDRIVKDVTHESICQDYNKLIYPFGENDELLNKPPLSKQQELNKKLDLEMKKENAKNEELVKGDEIKIENNLEHKPQEKAKD